MHGRCHICRDGDFMGDKRITVAYADDNLAVRRLYKGILKEDEELEPVGEAANGLELLSLIRDKKPKVVVLDIIMPKLDGLDVIRRVQEDDGIRPKPVFIAVSAIGDDRITREAFEAGAQYYIMKPLEKDVLLQRIHWAVDWDDQKRKSEAARRRNTYTDVEITVADMLLRLGMPVHIIGQHYCREALCMAMNDRECVSSITKLLYPDVARKFRTTPARVERAMRHAIEVVWTKGDGRWLQEIFRRPAGNVATRPTNSEFIAGMAEYMAIKASIDS